MKKFEKWLKEICRWDRDDWFLHWRFKTNIPGEMWNASCFIYTHNYRYCITAKEAVNGNSYLGCTVSCRMPRAGEDWTRGHDLADGEFTRETWHDIKDDIIQNELVKVIKPVRQEGVPEDVVERPSLGD